MKKYVDLLLGDHVLRWKCAKCNERFSPTAATHAAGIEAARRAVEELGAVQYREDHPAGLAIEAAINTIAALTADAPEGANDG